MQKLAVLVACHNRRQQTVSTVQELLSQAGQMFELAVFVYDAASSDGTAKALRQLGPQVRVIDGTSDNYWASSMRIVATQAEKWQPDFMLLLNDDVELAQGIFNVLKSKIDSLPAFDSARVVLVGEIIDHESGKIIYGARRQSSSDPFQFPLIEGAQRADTFNGNFVFIGAAAYLTVRGFPNGFRHGYADFLLGLRLSRAGFALERLVQVAGFGVRNDVYAREKDPRVPFRQRFKIALSPFGMPPWQQFRYCAEVAGAARAPLNLLRSYRRVFLP